jgi:hypothetical protein
VIKSYVAYSGDKSSSRLGQFSGNWCENYLETLQPTTDLLALLQQYGKSLPLHTTVSSTYAFTEVWEPRGGGIDVMTSGAIPRRRLLNELGWSLEEALETRMRLQSFEEDWNAPGMEAYDDM